MTKLLSVNKKARFKYEILETLEAGLVLEGSETKSIREGRASIAESFGRMREDEAYLYNMDIAPYEAASYGNHERKRPRKLLLHRAELRRVAGFVSQRGYTMVPLSLYFKRGWAKVELGVAKGKSQHDKREALRKREAGREMRRASGSRRA